jgi:hypothetical protein
MMSNIRFNLKRHVAWTVAFFVVFATGVLVIRAQAPTPPYALFQYASLTASGNTITATQVPVVTAPGVTVYENLTLQFSVDGNGNLTLSPGYPQAIPAPTILTSGIKAGTYVGPPTILSGNMLVAVTGPGVTDGGATQWTLSTTGAADPCTYPTSATWYVGPISSSPYAARLQAAGITSTAWSYGIANSNAYDTCQSKIPGIQYAYWVSGNLIGVSQVGNTLTIASFTSEGNADKNVPLDQITYTLKQ